MTVFSNTRFGRVRQIGRNTGLVALECPGCGIAVTLSEDVYRGRAPTEHRCSVGYAETHDFAKAVEAGGGWRTV